MTLRCFVVILLFWPPTVFAGDVEPTEVVLRFGGDCIFARHYAKAAGDSVDIAFKDLDLLKTADVSMVNLECPVTTRGQSNSKPYAFRMSPRYLSALTSAGIDVVDIANNHVCDFGRVGLYDTLSYLDSVGVRHVGAGRDRQDAHRPVIMRIKGRYVALFGYYSGDEAFPATETSGGVAGRSVDGIKADIDSVRRQYPSAFVVVSLHWGTEGVDTPEHKQVTFAHDVVKAGADLIIGHHPHVLQGIERYKSGVIVYSLGNLIFGGKNQEAHETALFEARLTKGGIRYRLIPVLVERWRARELRGERSERVIRHVRQLSQVFPNSIF